MLRVFLVFSVFFCGVVPGFSGTKDGAERIVLEHRLAMLEWEQKLNAAVGAEEKNALAKLVPDGEAYGKRMMNEIGKNLKEGWSVPYATWLLYTHSGLTIDNLKYLIGYMEQNHMQSEHLGEFSVALVGAGSGDQASAAGVVALKVKFIESVLKSEVASKREKSEAALGMSMLLGSMGEGSSVNERRLKLLRMAIIGAAESKVAGTTVAELAKEELYRLTKLTKGQLAPELVGVDASGVPMKLSDFRGKVVMLVFWSSWEQGAEALEFLRKSEKMHLGKPYAVVGVNRDTSKNLKDLNDLGRLPGRHFSDPNQKLFGVYRVQVSPFCYVLGKDGKVQYSGQLGSFADLTADAILAE